MKKMNVKSGCLLCLLICLACATMAGEGKPFTLKGKVKGADNKYIYLSYPKGEKYHTDSVLIKKGNFELRGDLEYPAMASLVVDRGLMMRWDPKLIGQLFIEPGQLKVQFEAGQLDQLKLSGSKTHDEYQELQALQATERQLLKALTEQYDKLNEAYMAAKKAGKDEAALEADKNKLQAVKEQMEPYYERMGENDERFMRDHPNSFVTAYLLSTRVTQYPYEKSLSFYNKLPDAAKKSAYGEQIIKEIEEIKMGSPGATAHLFSKTDINGQRLNLADFKGKYVLIDFWASWCVPCRKGNPHLIKLYRQYKNRGFEIIGVSDDDRNEEAWKKAVNKDGIGIWKHVLRGLDMDKRMKDEANPEDLSNYYGISSLPTKILIDKNGVIIGRYGTEEAELDAKLAELMPEKTTLNLKATIKGLKDSMIFISYYADGKIKTDSVRVENEKFQWQAKMNEPQKITIGSSRQYMQLFAENADIEIDGDAESLYYSKVTGSSSQDEYAAFNASLSTLDSVLMSQYQALHKTKDDTKRKVELETRIDSLRKLFNAEEAKFIVNNPSSPVSIDLVENKGIMGEASYVDSLFNLLSPEARATASGKRVEERIEVLKRSAIGANIKDFVIPSMNGKKVRISDFKGKYLFIDFWASWCGPCRAENPNVLKAYNKYKNKNFTVLGISLDDNGAKWKEAVAKDKMPWTQVSDLKGFNAEVSTYYGIMAIPSTLLVDPYGKIIDKNLRGEKLHQRLESLLN